MQDGAEAEADAAFHLRPDLSGLTAMPQSTAQTTRSTLSRALCVQADLGDLGHEGAEEFVHGDAAEACPCGMALPQPAFSAASLSTPAWRG